MDEIAVINLDGTNVDSDPQKELLLGVCNLNEDLMATLISCTETLRFHALYIGQLLRACCTESERITIMDIQVRPNSTRELK